MSVERPNLQFKSKNYRMFRRDWIEQANIQLVKTNEGLIVRLTKNISFHSPAEEKKNLFVEKAFLKGNNVLADARA